MAAKTSYGELERRIRELEEEAVSNARLKDQLQLANRELENKDLQMEEHFVKGYSGDIILFIDIPS